MYKLNAVFVVSSEIPALDKTFKFVVFPCCKNKPRPFQIKQKYACSGFLKPLQPKIIKSYYKQTVEDSYYSDKNRFLLVLIRIQMFEYHLDLKY